MQFLITCCLEMVGRESMKNWIGQCTIRNQNQDSDPKSKKKKKQEQRPTKREDNGSEPRPDTNHALAFTENNTSSLLQQLQRHIKNKREREKNTIKKVQTYPQTPKKRQDKDNDKDRTRQDIFSNTIKKMETKAAHAQHGLPHTSIHSHTSAHNSNTPPSTRNSNYVPMPWPILRQKI